MSETVKPRQFWVELNPSFPGPYNSTLKKYDCYNREMPQKEVPQMQVIELAPMIKMMDEMAEVLWTRDCDKIINTEGSGMFNKHSPDCVRCKKLESYKAFKRENGLE